MPPHYVGEPNPRTMFVEGPFGAGKTAFAIETLFAWLDAGIPSSQILVLVPQRTLARRYVLALRQSEHGPLGDIQVRTIGGLAKETVNVYWPLIAAEYGFANPDQPPQFLTIETSQYAMDDFVTQAVDRGEFDAISVSPQQIARQIVDNLNKAVLMGVDHSEIPSLLISAWGTERPRKRALAYEAAGRVAQAFRQHCLQNRLLDFSLQMELFDGLLRRPEFKQQFFERHDYLIAENLEEETAFTHDLLREWLPVLKGGLLTYEIDSGYRIFLGADPQGAFRLRDLCDGILEMHESRITSPELEALHSEIGYTFRREGADPAPDDAPVGFRYAFHTYFPQMLDWTADQIAELVYQQGVPAHEIAILAPFLSDALRFSLDQKLAQRGIATLSHRPSRALRDESAARCLLTLTALAHPQWERRPPPADVAHALEVAIEGLDPVRAALLAKVTYHPRGKDILSSFDKIRPEMQNRITYTVGKHYERLRNWLENYRSGSTAPLDHFFARLFGEVISQTGFGFHSDSDAGRVAAELVESARKFRRELFPKVTSKDAQALDEIGRRYFEIVERGLLAALYVASWRDEQADAVFIAPAYTFLMRSRAVSVQFWLDVGSVGWWERLDQPLTHPYVLSREWEAGQVWSDVDEYDRQQEMLYRLLSGLIRRCRKEIVLGISDYGEQGYEQRGPLLRIFQSILRRHPQEGEAA